jgi:NAD(P)-dependent dehydrogenase (short-subunit alcohol dehydrogenase family)
MNSQSSEADVALVINAETDAGYQTAQRLLQAGYRVVVTAQHAAGLTRILHGHSASRVVAFAVDTSDSAQVQRLFRGVEDGFGRIDLVVRPKDYASVVDGTRGGTVTRSLQQAMPSGRTSSGRCTGFHSAPSMNSAIEAVNPCSALRPAIGPISPAAKKPASGMPPSSSSIVDAS